MKTDHQGFWQGIKNVLFVLLVILLSPLAVVVICLMDTRLHRFGHAIRPLAMVVICLIDTPLVLVSLIGFVVALFAGWLPGVCAGLLAYALLVLWRFFGTLISLLYWIAGTPLRLVAFLALVVALSAGWLPGLCAGIMTYAILALLWQWPFSGSRHYLHYVEHPRYGRQPRYTGLAPAPLFLPWRLFGGIQGTAILADLSRQTSGPHPMPHYFDLRKTCRDCQRQFIFFAEEQKYWYEELGLLLDVDCPRCPICRKDRKTQRRYEQLCHVPERTADENLEMADACLTLIEHGRFSVRKTERVRMLLRRIPEDLQASQACVNLRVKLAEIEQLAPSG